MTRAVATKESDAAHRRADGPEPCLHATHPALMPTLYVPSGLLPPAGTEEMVARKV